VGSDFDWVKTGADERVVTWFDTFDFALWQGALALIACDRQWALHPLHHGWPAANPLFGSDAPSGTPRPVSQLPAPWQEHLAPFTGIRALLPVATARHQQQAVDLRGRNAKTVVRLQIHTFQHPDESAPRLQLIQLQPLRGYAPEADAVVEILLANRFARCVEGPLAACFRAFDQPVRDRSVRPPDSDARSTPARSVVTACLLALLQNVRIQERGILHDWDTEFLHDYRVNLRKMRAILRIFADVYPPAVAGAVLDTIAAMARATNRLRDLDVQILAEEALVQQIPTPLQPALAPLFAAFRVERASEQAALVRRLSRSDYGAAMEQIAQLLQGAEDGPEGQEPFAPLLGRHLRKRYRRIRKQSRGLTVDSSPADFHRIRIGCKKLRYLLDLAPDLYPGAFLPLLQRRLRKLQNRLGALNDYQVQVQSLLAHHATLVTPDPACSLAIGALVGTLHAASHNARPPILDALKAFRAKVIAEKLDKQCSPTVQP